MQESNRGQYMEFNCLGTGSTGNCYLIRTGSFNILLDAGVPIKKIIKNINLNDLDFAYISHKHNDHSLSLKNLKNRGVKIVDGIDNNKFCKISKNEEFGDNLDLFLVPLDHKDCVCNALIIKNHQTNECILYATDFCNCEYNISQFRFTSIIIECNYMKELVINDDKFSRTKENIERHLSLDGLHKFLSKIDLTKCNEIILTHFSNEYSNPTLMACEIFFKYNLKVIACKKNGGYDKYE